MTLFMLLLVLAIACLLGVAGVLHVKFTVSTPGSSDLPRRKKDILVGILLLLLMILIMYLLVIMGT